MTQALGCLAACFTYTLKMNQGTLGLNIRWGAHPEGGGRGGGEQLPYNLPKILKETHMGPPLN